MDKLQQAWTAILDALSKVIVPDWGGLVALIPVGVAVLIVLWLGFLVRQFATIGPRQRGVAGRPPVPPPGVHAATPSFAPVFAAVGVVLLFYGFVWGGPILVLGLGALLLTLLYWLREGMLDYDHVAGATILPAIVAEHEGPPPGVHVPGPTFLPVISAVAVAILFLGVLLGGLVLLASLVCLVLGLIGWLRAANTEYHLTEEADLTGHLRNPAPPRFPTRLFGSYAIILAVAIVVQAGILPPHGTDAAGGSPAPGASAPAGGGASGSAAPATPAGPAADVTIVAEQIAFTTPDVSAPAGKAFTIAFTNKDQGTQHNVEIKKPDGSDAFKGQIVTGPTTTTYNVPALPAGSYTFNCSVHPTMTGTLTVK
jgi:plastocyanin